jgi:hypothetical protein
MEALFLHLLIPLSFQALAILCRPDTIEQVAFQRAAIASVRSFEHSFD